MAYIIFALIDTSGCGDPWTVCGGGARRRPYDEHRENVSLLSIGSLSEKPAVQFSNTAPYLAVRNGVVVERPITSVRFIITRRIDGRELWRGKGVGLRRRKIPARKRGENRVGQRVRAIYDDYDNTPSSLTQKPAKRLEYTCLVVSTGTRRPTDRPQRYEHECRGGRERRRHCEGECTAYTIFFGRKKKILSHRSIFKKNIKIPKSADKLIDEKSHPKHAFWSGQIFFPLSKPEKTSIKEDFYSEIPPGRFYRL